MYDMSWSSMASKFWQAIFILLMVKQWERQSSPVHHSPIPSATGRGRTTSSPVLFPIFLKFLRKDWRAVLWREIVWNKRSSLYGDWSFLLSLICAAIEKFLSCHFLELLLGFISEKSSFEDWPNMYRLWLSRGSAHGTSPWCYFIQQFLQP